MDKNQRAKELISRYHQGTASPEELLLVEQWFLIDLEKSEVVPNQVSFEKADQRISANLSAHIAGAKPDKGSSRLWPRIAMAAAAVAAIVFGVWFYNTSYMNDRHPDAGQDLALVHQDIAPGKNGATITLGNGKVIQLSDKKSGVVIGNGKLAYNDGSSVGSRNEFGTGSRNSKGGGPDLYRSSTARANDVMLTASTSRGQTYQFTLPDGTNVWLNADSKIEFPSNFVNSKTRNVKLSGEGYFEVSKDKAHPFIVATEGQEVKVLGTHFNINSYANEESIKTTLLEGSVMVSHQGKQVSRVVLKPGMQSELDDIGLSSKEVDVEEIVAWKAGDFIFTKVSLADIMKSIARWYDVEVSYDSGVDADQTFSVLVSRNKNISQILLSLEKTGKVKFKIEGKKVKVGK